MKKIFILFITILSLILTNAFSQITPVRWDLETCIEYARRENIQIKRSQIALAQSWVDTRTAHAALFPNLSFSTSYNFTTQPFIDNNEGDKISYSGNYGLNSSWTVWNGGRRLKTIEQQKMYTRVAELNIQQTQNTIEESITQTYLQILYASESVTTNENTVAVSLAQVERARELLAVGSISRSDLAQLESQYSNNKYMLIVAQTTLRNYKLQLKQLLEFSENEEIEVVNPAIPDSQALSPLPDKMEVYSAALSLRPEIKSSIINMDISDMDISIARAAYLPTISLSAGLGTGHNTGSELSFTNQLKDRLNGSLGLTLSLPIFNNRQTKSAVEKAQLAYEDSKLNFINEQKNLFYTIETIWLDAYTAQERFIAAQERLSSSLISYDLVSQQFDLGLKNTVELLTEQNNLLAAQQEVLQSKYMAILNMQLLRFYQGQEIQL